MLRPPSKQQISRTLQAGIVSQQVNIAESTCRTNTVGLAAIFYEEASSGQ